MLRGLHPRTCDTAEAIASCNLTCLLLCDSLATSCLELRSPARETGERVSCPSMPNKKSGQRQDRDRPAHRRPVTLQVPQQYVCSYNGRFDIIYIYKSEFTII
jgi:hypothetical protein